MLRRLALASLVCLSAAPPAAAGGRVLTEPGAPLAVRAVKIAVATAPSSTTEWLSLEVDGGPGRFVLVLPAPAGTKLDPALDAFFSALDTSTAPRVRPPKPVLACGSTHAGSFEDTSQGFAGALSPESVAVLDDLVQLGSFAAQEGVVFEAEDAQKLGTVAAGRFIAIVYELPTTSAVTETLRALRPVGAAPVGLDLFASGSIPEVELFAIAEGRAKLSGVTETLAADLGSEWHVLSGVSSYLADRHGYLVGAPGGRAVIEASGSTPLFGWNVLPDGAGALAPGVKTYFDRAKKEGAGIAQSDLCTEPVWDAIAAGKSGARLARVCAPGALTSVPGGAACDEAPAAGEISAALLRCGAADDVAFALAGMRADRVRITRHVTVVGPATPTTTELAVSEGPSVSLSFAAASADTTGCVNGNAGAGGTTGGAGYAGYGGDGGYGASNGYYDPTPVPEPEPQVDVSCWVEVADSCGSGGGGGSGEDSCSGDSSSDSDGDTCSGDSTSSSEEGDTCSGDSSSSSEGDTCAGDSSSGSEGDTCSGGDSGGDSCSSGSGSSGSGDCSVRRRPRKLRVSALFLLVSAIALPLRRGTRRRGRP